MHTHTHKTTVLFIYARVIFTLSSWIIRGARKWNAGCMVLSRMRRSDHLNFATCVVVSSPFSLQRARFFRACVICTQPPPRLSCAFESVGESASTMRENSSALTRWKLHRIFLMLIKLKCHLVGNSAVGNYGEYNRFFLWFIYWICNLVRKFILIEKIVCSEILFMNHFLHAVVYQ